VLVHVRVRVCDFSEPESESRTTTRTCTPRGVAHGFRALTEVRMRVLSNPEGFVEIDTERFCFNRSAGFLLYRRRGRAAASPRDLGPTGRDE
jgi:hypothetical protein